MWKVGGLIAPGDRSNVPRMAAVCGTALLTTCACCWLARSSLVVY